MSDTTKSKKVFRFWWDVTLNLPFPAKFAVVQPQEVWDSDNRFEQIVEAVQNTPCSWVMLEVAQSQLETSERLTESEIKKHSKAFHI